MRHTQCISVTPGAISVEAISACAPHTNCPDDSPETCAYLVNLLVLCAVTNGGRHRQGRDRVNHILDVPSHTHTHITSHVRFAFVTSPLSCSLCRAESNTLRGLPFRPLMAVAVDLFPHTEHCEMIMLFERTEGAERPDTGSHKKPKGGDEK